MGAVATEPQAFFRTLSSVVLRKVLRRSRIKVESVGREGGCSIAPRIVTLGEGRAPTCPTGLQVVYPLCRLRPVGLCTPTPGAPATCVSAAAVRAAA